MIEQEIITLKLPAYLARELKDAEQAVMTDLLQRGLRDLHIEQALAQYQRGEMSFGAASAQAGLTQSKMAAHAYARGLEPPYSEKTVTEDLQ